MTDNEEQSERCSTQHNRNQDENPNSKAKSREKPRYHIVLELHLEPYEHIQSIPPYTSQSLSLY